MFIPNHHFLRQNYWPTNPRTSDLCLVSRKRKRKRWAESKPPVPSSSGLMETLAKQLVSPAGVLHRGVRFSSVQRGDLGLTSTGPCATKPMTSNTSQQKWESLKGAWGEKDSISLHTQRKAEHNYQDVSTQRNTFNSTKWTLEPNAV